MMAEEGWRKVCRQEDLREGAPVLVKAGEEEVCVTLLEGTVHAVANKCTHYECPLNEGLIIGHVVTCKCHDARFDLRTGRVLSPPALNDLPVYPVRVSDGDVLIGPAEKPRFPKPEGADPRAFLIIGGGAAGNAAAETLRREGFAGRIVMVTAEADLPYDRPNLSKEYMSGDAKPEWMPLRSAKFYSNQRIEVLSETRVVSLDAAAKSALLSTGQTVPFDKALLATGGAPRRLSAPGAEGEGCFPLRSFADARLISQAAASARRTVLIGAGFIGMELASSLRKRGLEVTVVFPEALPMVRLLGEEVAAGLRKRHEKDGVSFVPGQSVTEIAGRLGSKTVTLSSGSRLEADFIVYGIGVQPVVDYLQGTPLLERGAVPVDARLRTRNPDIHAAGDIAVVPDTRTGAGVRIEHWVVAERQGQHAARAMLGSDAPYAEVPFFWTRQTGASLKYVGFAVEWDQVALRGDVEKGKFLAGYYSAGVLLAAAGMGMANELTAVKVMMERKIPLPAARLSDGSTDLQEMARGQAGVR